VTSNYIVCAPKIYTANEAFETAECFAFGQGNGVFTFVGSRQQVTEKYPDARIRELGQSMTVLPGLYDSHGHIMHVSSLFVYISKAKYGEMLENVDLFGATSFEGINHLTTTHT
jgi:predicted amidohydrolase YtcJ